MRPVLAQARVELLLTLRRGESVLLTFAIPMLLLWFFSTVDVLPTPDHLDDPVDFLVPGILALAVMSTAMVSLAIATGFERSTGVLKLLGSTPLTRRQLLAAKIGAIVVVEILQLTVLVVEGRLLGWEVDGAQVGAALAALGARDHRVRRHRHAHGRDPARRSPPWPRPTASTWCSSSSAAWWCRSTSWAASNRWPKLLPSGALSEAVHGALEGTGVPAASWAVLAAWAVVTPAGRGLALPLGVTRREAEAVGVGAAGEDALGDLLERVAVLELADVGVEEVGRRNAPAACRGGATPRRPRRPWPARARTTR